MNELKRLINRLIHRHDWYGLSNNEWKLLGGFGTPTYICTKCGERRHWCDIK